MFSGELAAGRLEVVLPRYEPLGLDIYVIFSSRQSLPLRVRSFLEFLKDWARTPPPWATAPRAAAKPTGTRPRRMKRRAASDATDRNDTAPRRNA